MATILTEIAAYKRDFVEQAKTRYPLSELIPAALDTAAPADFLGALEGDEISLIAELKKASPSKGVIRADFDPEKIARIYAHNGARALSVLTDEAYFQGSNAYLPAARRAAELPVLRKDFTIDPYQVYEARLIGADAVLLIVALLDGGQLEDLLGLAGDLGLTVLVEVHTGVEVERALQVGARLIGINNRDLKTFRTTLETSFELRSRLPAGVTVVSESGIECRQDMERLSAAGVDAVLVGEALMRAADIGAEVRALLGR